jgi:hypothetical protein
MASSAGQSTSGRMCFVFFLRFLKVFTIIALLFNVASFIFSIVAGVQATNLSDLDKAFIVLGSTGYIFFNIVLILSEFDVPFLMRFVMGFHYWAGRGLGMVWIGVLTINSAKQLAASFANTAGLDGYKNAVEIIGQVAGWVLISIGVLYVIMSLLCLRKIVGDADDDLEDGLLKGDKAAAVASVRNAEDALVIANMAIALGMPVDDCRSMFAGKAGTKSAEKLVKQRAEQLAKAAGAAAVDRAAYRLEPVTSSVTTAANNVNAAATTVNSTVRAATGPSSTGRSLNDDDDNPRRKGMDDEELERAYYASRTETK